MSKKKLKPRSPFLGRWHIVSMSMWDEDYLNEEVQAFIEFDDKGAASSSSGSSGGSSTTGRGLGTAYPASNGRGRAATRWTRAWDGAGRSSATGGSSG
jgi:hypothetical protein